MGRIVIISAYLDQGGLGSLEWWLGLCLGGHRVGTGDAIRAATSLVAIEFAAVV